MATRKLALLVCVAVFTLFGCQIIENVQGQQATAVPTDTPQLTSTHTLAPTVDTAATQGAQQTTDAQGPQDTQAAEATRIEMDKQATADQQAALQSTEQAQAGATATAHAGQFVSVISQLVSEGKVTTTEGDYYHLADFDEAQAKINYFFQVDTGYSAENFVLQTDMAWDSASMSANWPTSGCGVVFGRTDEDNFDFTYLGLDGMVNIIRSAKGNQRLLTYQRWGKPDLPEGRAKFRLVVWNKRITVYVNESQISSMQDAAYGPGEIALTLVSGTNADFGTRCQMTDTNLFISR
jgi:hypothetical protein